MGRASTHVHSHGPDPSFFPVGDVTFIFVVLSFECGKAGIHEHNFRKF